MIRLMLGVWLALSLNSLWAAPRTDADVAAAVEFAPPPGAAVPSLDFIGSDGPLRLQSLLARRPSLMTFAWFECTNLCGLTLNGLADSSGRLLAKNPQDFQVIVVSLDATAGRDQAQRQKRRLASQYPNADIDRRWHFLTGSSQAIGDLARAIGYRYIYDERKDQFAHPAGIVALSREGRLVDYRAGMNYRAADLAALLRTIESGVTARTAPNPVLLLCYDYDPSSGRYSLAIMKLLRLTAILALLTFAGAILYWQRKRRQGYP